MRGGAKTRLNSKTKGSVWRVIFNVFANQKFSFFTLTLVLLQLLGWMSRLKWPFLTTSGFDISVCNWQFAPPLSIFTPNLTPAFLGESTGRTAGTGCPFSPAPLGLFRDRGRWEVSLFVCLFLVVAGSLLEAETKLCFCYWGVLQLLVRSQWGGRAAQWRRPLSFRRPQAISKSSKWTLCLSKGEFTVQRDTFVTWWNF